MKTKLVVVLAAVAVVLVATGVSLRAHHAFSAEFDANKPLTFKGTISKMEWTNPHVWLHLDVKKPDGSTKESVKAGMEVAVDGYQAKDGSHRANGRDLTFADGRKMFLGATTGTGAPYELTPETPKKKQ